MKKVKLIEKKQFIAKIIDLNYKTFIIYIVALNININIKVYISKKIQIANLNANKTFIEVFNKYANFKDVFLLKLTIELFKYNSINNYTI